MKRAYKTYSKEQIEIAIKNSKCWREVMAFLNPDNKGYRGSEYNIKKTAIKFGLTFPHFVGSNWSKGKNLGPKKPIEDYFNGANISSNNLKKRLIKEGIRENKCECCGNFKWLDINIPLELHHKDGNHKNNKLENLEIICANCHYYKHKKSEIYKEKQLNLKLKNKQKYRPDKKNKICLKCGQPSVNKFCSYKCSHLASRKVIKPTKEQLEKLVWEKSSVQISKDLGLKSSTMISKWCKEYGISKPPRGYWEKIYHAPIVQEQETLPLEGKQCCCNHN